MIYSVATTLNHAGRISYLDAGVIWSAFFGPFRHQKGARGTISMAARLKFRLIAGRRMNEFSVCARTTPRPGRVRPFNVRGSGLGRTTLARWGQCRTVPKHVVRALGNGRFRKSDGRAQAWYG